VKLADGTVKTLPYNCADFAKHNAPTHLGITTVATINLDAPDAAPQRSSILGEVGGYVLDSPTRLRLTFPQQGLQLVYQRGAAVATGSVTGTAI
jgi:hypothetical protein